MKNITDCYKKGNHPLDNSKLKSILSIFIIGIFIFFGLASIEEGNPTTKETSCEFFKPPMLLTQKITIYIYDKQTQQPMKGQYITFFIKDYEKVSDNNLCHLKLKNAYIRTFTLNADGIITFILSKNYVSSDDALLLDFTFSRTGYNQFTEAIPVSFISELYLPFGALKKVEYP